MRRKLAPIHPGTYLRETLEKLAHSAGQLAGTTPMRLSLVLRGQRPESAGYWVNLQAQYDLDTASDAADAALKRIGRLEQAIG